MTTRNVTIIDGEVRVTAKVHDVDLVFVFTDEGVITDLVVGGEVTATESSTYDEIAGWIVQ